METIRTSFSGHEEPQAIPSHAFRVLILYDEMESGRKAMETMRQTGERGIEGFCIFPLLWRLDMLADLHWSKMVKDDAVHADLFVIALSNPKNLGPALFRWN